MRLSRDEISLLRALLDGHTTLVAMEKVFGISRKRLGLRMAKLRKKVGAKDNFHLALMALGEAEAPDCLREHAWTHASYATVDYAIEQMAHVLVGTLTDDGLRKLILMLQAHLVRRLAESALYLTAIGGTMCFEQLYESSMRGELILIDGGFCHWHLRRDGQLTIREIIATRPGAGSEMLNKLKLVPGARFILAKCPVDLQSNHWYRSRGFQLSHIELTRSTKKRNQCVAIRN